MVQCSGNSLDRKIYYYIKRRTYRATRNGLQGRSSPLLSTEHRPSGAPDEGYSGPRSFIPGRNAAVQAVCSPPHPSLPLLPLLPITPGHATTATTTTGNVTASPFTITSANALTTLCTPKAS
ncbi:hypothetical protein E2C01_087280 [Portunus trituberculatus]|uniref:Uncharacterized protein n=1 Tax=Portunus trituberculatus TaxID=210409 RepID=A0A5B7JIN1_PORTR|nr:hypothetical protein [Portunus trituberculatus]